MFQKKSLKRYVALLIAFVMMFSLFGNVAFASQPVPSSAELPGITPATVPLPTDIVRIVTPDTRQMVVNYNLMTGASLQAPDMVRVYTYAGPGADILVDWDTAGFLALDLGTANVDRVVTGVLDAADLAANNVTNGLGLNAVQRIRVIPRTNLIIDGDFEDGGNFDFPPWAVWASTFTRVTASTGYVRSGTYALRGSGATWGHEYAIQHFFHRGMRLHGPGEYYMGGAARLPSLDTFDYGPTSFAMWMYIPGFAPHRPTTASWVDSQFQPTEPGAFTPDTGYARLSNTGWVHVHNRLMLPDVYHLDVDDGNPHFYPQVGGNGQVPPVIYFDDFELVPLNTRLPANNILSLVVNPIPSIAVAEGTVFNALPLPTTLNVNLQRGGTANVGVTWLVGDYTPTEGTYTLTGVFTETALILNQNNVVPTIIVEVSSTLQNNDIVQIIPPNPRQIVVDYDQMPGYNLQLPTTVRVLADDGSIEDVAVDWDAASVSALDLTTAGVTRTITGALNVASMAGVGITNSQAASLAVTQEIRVIEWTNILINGGFEDDRIGYPYWHGWGANPQERVTAPVRTGTYALRTGGLTEGHAYANQHNIHEAIRVHGPGEFYVGGAARLPSGDTFDYGPNSFIIWMYFSGVGPRPNTGAWTDSMFVPTEPGAFSNTTGMAQLSNTNWVYVHNRLMLPDVSTVTSSHFYPLVSRSNWPAPDDVPPLIYFDDFSIVPLNTELPSNNIVSQITIPQVTVVEGTAFAALGLPATVNTLLGTGPSPVGVTWAQGAFDPDQTGFQTIEGTFVLTGDMTNHDNVIPQVTIRVLAIGESPGERFYFSTAGCNTNDGLSPLTPREYLTNAFIQSLNAGDEVLFNRGDVWNIQGSPTWDFRNVSGSPQWPIVLSTYGTGGKPQFVNLHHISDTWQDDGSGVWSVPWAVSQTDTFMVYVDMGIVDWALRTSTPAAMANNSFLVYNGRLHLRGFGNPTTRLVEVNTTNAGAGINLMYFQNSAFLTFEDLIFRGAGGYGSLAWGAGPNNDLVFRNIEYRQFVGGGLVFGNLIGLAGDLYNILVEGSYFNRTWSNTIHESRLANGSFNLSSSALRFVNAGSYMVIRDNVFINLGHSAIYIGLDDPPFAHALLPEIRGNIIENNIFIVDEVEYGRAIAFSGDHRLHSNIFRNNYIWGMPIAIHLLGRDNLVYGNVFNTTVPNRAHTYAWQPWSLNLGPWVNHCGLVHISDRNVIINNTFYNAVDNFIFLAAGGASFTGDNLIANNIFHTWEGSNAVAIMPSVAGTTTVAYNAFFNGFDRNVIIQGGTHTVETANALPNMLGNMQGDPWFENVVAGIGASDFSLRSNSPYLDAGISPADLLAQFPQFTILSVLLDDNSSAFVGFDGVPFYVDAPTVGAFSSPVTAARPYWTDGTLEASNITDTSFVLTWSGASADAIGYYIFVDGVLFATVGNVNTATISGALPQGLVNVVVEAFNAAGYVSMDGPTKIVTIGEAFTLSGSVELLYANWAPIGAVVAAVQATTGAYISTIIDASGTFSFSLPVGTFEIAVTFPDAFADAQTFTVVNVDIDNVLFQLLLVLNPADFSLSISDYAYVQPNYQFGNIFNGLGNEGGNRWSTYAYDPSSGAMHPQHPWTPLPDPTRDAYGRIDLGGLRVVAGVELMEHGGGMPAGTLGVKFGIWVSDDGVNFTRILPFPGSAYPGAANYVQSSGEGNTVWQSFRFDEPVEARYMRIHVYGQGDGTGEWEYWSSIAQMMIIGFAAPDFTAPTITGPETMSLVVGYAATYTTAFTIDQGTPAATVTRVSDPGITWNAVQNRWDIAAGLAVGDHTATITAENLAGTVTHTFTLTITAAPVAPTITGPETMSLVAGYAATHTTAFTINLGAPTATVTRVSDPGITWNAAQNRWDIASGLAVGDHTATITAENLAGTATHTFTLTITAAPAAPTITGPTALSRTVGYAAFSTNAFTITGAQPITVTQNATHGGRIVWNASTNRLDISAGLSAGTYAVVLTATNAVGSDTHTFTLTVNQATQQAPDSTPVPPQATQAPPQPTPTPAPTPIVDTTVVITVTQQEEAMEEAEDIVVEVDDMLTITIPADVIENLTEGEDEAAGLYIHVTIYPPLEPTEDTPFELEVEFSVNKGDEAVTEVEPGITIEVNLRDFDLEGLVDDFNPQRVIVELPDGTLVQGVFDLETGVFTFETTAIGNFSIIYAPTLRIIGLEIGSFDIMDLLPGDLLVVMDVVPVIQDNRTLIPLRFVAEIMGASVYWNVETREVTIVRNGQTLTFAIGEMASGMDIPAQIMDNRTMVPLRFIAEFFNATVYWDDATRSITIIYR